MTRAIALVADDNPALRETLAAFLQEEGYYVLPAATGQDALAHVVQASPRPDILLLDLLMPTLDGYAVLDRLRQHADLDVPVLIFSAHRPAPSLLPALDGKRRDVIPTSVDLEDSYIRLQRLLRQTLTRSQNQSQDSVRTLSGQRFLAQSASW